MLDWIWQNSEKLSQIATILTGVAAVFALGVAGWQVKKTRESQQRTTAYQVYTEFLLHSLRYSDFLVPNIDVHDMNNATWKGSEKKFAEYEVYVDLMIAAFEEIITVYGVTPATKSYLRSYLDPHKTYLGSSRFRKHEGELAPAFLRFFRKTYMEPESETVDASPAPVGVSNR